MEELKVISITHKQVGLDLLGKLHLDEDRYQAVLSGLKKDLGIDELIYLSTCNRIELVVNHKEYFCSGKISQLIEAIHAGLKTDEKTQLINAAEVRSGEDAFRYLIEVASSLHSMVLGEREIITQMRKAFERSREHQLSGDLLRLVMKKVIEGAKRVFTETKISRKPVSVVSLAWHTFRARSVSKDDPILLIGAGQVINNFARFLKKNDYTNITVFNRTEGKAKLLAKEFSGEGYSLEKLGLVKSEFRAIISCTGAATTIIGKEKYKQLLNGDESARLLIDLALPHDIDPSITSVFNAEYVGMPQLKEMADENLKSREKELNHAREILMTSCEEFDEIYHQRQVELAMKSIPEKIREIKDTALGVVFAKELEDLDGNSREVLDKILVYLEKKYISVPMKMAREVMLDRQNKN